MRHTVPTYDTQYIDPTYDIIMTCHFLALSHRLTVALFNDGEKQKCPTNHSFMDESGLKYL